MWWRMAKSSYMDGRRAAHADAMDPDLGPEFVIMAAKDSKKLSTFAAGYRAVATELLLRSE